MHHFFVPPEQIYENTIEITGQDVRHIRNVLRMSPGEEVGVCCDGEDLDYRCRIASIGEEKVTLEILWKEHTNAELPCRITLYQGLPKSDKMELIIQKAVELGAARIVPVAMARSIVKLSAGKAQDRVRRWNAISESAAKQSKRARIPEVLPLMSFSQALEHASGDDFLLVPYEREEGMEATRQILTSIEAGKSISVFIGPEGGFEPSEIDAALLAGARTITLGERILRTETAGMTILSILMYLLDGK